MTSYSAVFTGFIVLAFVASAIGFVVETFTARLTATARWRDLLAASALANGATFLLLALYVVLVFRGVLNLGFSHAGSHVLWYAAAALIEWPIWKWRLGQSWGGASATTLVVNAATIVVALVLEQWVV